MYEPLILYLLMGVSLPLSYIELLDTVILIAICDCFTRYKAMSVDTPASTEYLITALDCLHNRELSASTLRAGDSLKAILRRDVF
jgi:hypothetical protein